MVTRQIEREDKYDVGAGVVLPDLDDLLGEGGRLEQETVTLTNRYLDTPAGDLRRAGITLRRRSGGHDSGWQLKLPSGVARTEIGSRSRSRTVPDEIAALVLGLTRGRPLEAVAELVTERRVHRLLDRDGRLRAEVADDRVQSTAFGDHEARLDRWREVEVELGPAGDEGLLSAVGERLRAAGAEPADRVSKLARALGPAASAPVSSGSAPETLAELIGGYVREQCAEIFRGDLAVRLGEPRVHKTRVAMRRLRSTLREFGELLDPGPTRRLDEELRWSAGLLGEVRDREVLQARLEQQLQELPPELVLGPVAADIDATLSGERAQHLRALTEALRTPRHLELLDALDRWQTEPPFLDGATAPADGVRNLVQRARRRMRRRLQRALREPSGPQQEQLLHTARKAAKRARYAAELAEPVWPKAAARVEEAKELQTVLGEHQDSVVAAEFLWRLGAGAGSGVDRNGFTYGVLFAEEHQRAARIRAGLGRGGR